MTSLHATARRCSQYASLLACVLACAVALAAAFPGAAQADVRGSDVVCGDTVDARGLSSALCPSIDANHALLVDDTGKVYFERAAHDPVKVASITKVMTAIVALEYDPQLDLQVEVTEDAAGIGESSAELLEGDVLNMRDALTAMMVVSGNDAAECVATAVGRLLLAGEEETGASDEVCVERFVREMNDKAVELGLEDTFFANPHGLDDGEFAGNHHSTAADVAKQVSYAMGIQAFRDVVGQQVASISVYREGQHVPIELQSTDEMLGMYEGTVGVKTGTTDEAGACFAGANDHDGREYYAIVLDSSDEYQRFLDTMALWDWCYAHWVDYPVVHSGETRLVESNAMQGSYPVVAYVGHADWTDRQIAATFADPNTALHVFELDGNVSQSATFNQVHGSVRAGDTLGAVEFIQRNSVIATVDLVAAEDSPAPNPLDGIGIWWQRLWGDDTVAESYMVSTSPALIDKTQTVAVG